jgi:hypothetical protein
VPVDGLYAVGPMSRQAHKKEEVVQTSASREEDICWLMGAEGMRLFRRQIPRWEAEQLVSPVGASLGQPTSSEERRKRQLERQKKLSTELHGHGAVGQAFQELCKAGCDEKWLEGALLGLADSSSFGRSHKVYSYKEKQLVTRAMANLDSAAADLTAFLDKTDLLFMHSSVRDWPVPLLRIPVFLRGIAYCLRKSIDDPNLPDFRLMTASFRIPHLIAEVRRRNCHHRSYYEQTATLIGAACEKHHFSATDLKMLVSRSNRFGRRPR